MLEQCSQGIIDKANTERPPGMDTDFVTQTTEQRATWINNQGSQSTEQASARNERVLRDALVASIKQRRMLIMLAVDSAWPAGVRENEGVRGEFQLPLNKAMSV